MEFPSELKLAVERHPHSLMFATVSGAHLYGFPSPNSDFDLRGVHILPVKEVIGLTCGDETIEVSKVDGNIELDLVTHDIIKFFRLLLRKNGYVLEQLFSPLVVHTTSEHAELKQIAKNCITKYHYYHYNGFANNQWRLFLKEKPRRIKPLLYVYRVLLTGIHLMRSGVVEANLVTLNNEFKLSFIDELVQQKLTGDEHQTLTDTDIQLHESEFDLLVKTLASAAEESALPEAPSGQAELDDLLRRVRLRTL